MFLEWLREQQIEQYTYLQYKKDAQTLCKLVKDNVAKVTNLYKQIKVIQTKYIRI